MGSQYSPAQIESLPEEKLSKARADLIEELKSWESAIGGRDRIDAKQEYAEAEYRRYMLAQIRERQLLSVTKKFNASTDNLVNLTKVLEYLTRVLIALTLLIFIQPLVVQVVTVWGLPFVAILFILATLYLTGYARRHMGTIFRPTSSS